MPADPAATRRLIESLSTHLEDHLATWKSSLVDARRDIEALLAAISDKIPAQAKPLFPEDVVSMMLEDVIPPPPPPETRIVERVVEKIVEKTVPGAAAPADWTLVRGSLSSVESARTQVDVLTRFIAQAATHASRVALLVLRNDRITGWKAMGFDASGGHDESVRSADLGAEEDAFASDVIRAQRSRLAEPPDESAPLRKALGGRPAARTLLVPMVIRDRLAGLVYADELPGEEGRLNEAAIEVLTFVTGLAVDLLAARKKIPSPALTPTGESIEHFRVVAHEAPAARPAPPLVFDVPAAAAPAGPAREPVKHAALEPPVSASGIRPRPMAAEEQLRALAESAGITRKPVPPAPGDAGVTVAVPTLVPPPPQPPPPHVAAPPPSHLLAPPPPPVPVEPPTPAAPPELDLHLEPVAEPAHTPPPPAPTVPALAPPPVPTRPPSSFPPPLSQTTTGDIRQAFDSLRGTAGPSVPAQVPPPAVIPHAPPPAPMTPPPTIPAVGAKPAAAAPTTEVRPISGFIPRSRLAGGAADPQRQRDDARRLARLLVSEIKLYNEKKVEEGRAANDLYERLKDDIDRSRQVFEERTPEAIRREGDFFRDELVRILADGRAEALGSAG